MECDRQLRGERETEKRERERQRQKREKKTSRGKKQKKETGGEEMEGRKVHRHKVRQARKQAGRG